MQVLATLLQDHVLGYSLVLFRVLGLFAFAPLLTTTMMPARVKGLVGVMLALCAYPLIDVSQVPGDLSLFAVMPIVVSEMLVGFIIGCLAAVPILMTDMAGAVMGQMMGLSLSRVYNPDYDSDVDVLGQLVFFAAMGIFITFGGVEAVFSSLLASFQHLPVGAAYGMASPMEVFLGVLNSGFELALRVSAPVMGAVLLLIVLLGVIGKTMPQINVMTVGFTLKLVVGISMLAMGVGAIREPIEEALLEALRVMSLWAVG